jgi:hypothetical protein
VDAKRPQVTFAADHLNELDDGQQNDQWDEANYEQEEFDTWDAANVAHDGYSEQQNSFFVDDDFEQKSD